jgi:cation-transporting ATPase E
MVKEIEYNGLSLEEVSQRKKSGQVNKQEDAGKYSVPRIVIENSFTAFNLINMLILSFLLFYYVRTKDYKLLYDSVGVVSVTLLNTLAGIIQKIKAARALAKVDLLKKDKITVIRNGAKVEIHTDEIVLDEVIFIQKGDQVPVDGEILSGHHLQIDESLLTGESLPQDKNSGDGVLSGSFCVYGSGFLLAQKVGKDNYATQVTHLAKKYKLLTSPLMKKINWIFFISFAVTIIMALIEFIHSYLGGSITVTEIRKISTIAFSLIPEGLVFFATVTFTLGIYRISKLGAIVQKINAIDAFSTIKVVCMDKTGTITKNNIKVAKITAIDEDNKVITKILGSYNRLSTEKNATIKALEEFEPFETYSFVDEIPFRSDLKMSIIRMKYNDITSTFFLGAYDVLLEKLGVNDEIKSKILFEKNNLKGFRNLIFGRIDDVSSGVLTPEEINKKGIVPLCIISMKDEAREDAHEALALFEKNQIKIKIVSGDSAESVRSTLDEIGWRISDKQIITGSELDLLSHSEFDSAVISKEIFVRLKPEHKLNIVRSLRKQHIQTAVIGDGVNDLPAIKEADLGITMEEGSSITKKVSDIVLLDNKFSILPSLFTEGNKIINTIKFVARLYLTKNFTIFFISLLSWFFDFVYPLTPRKSSLISILGVGIPCYIIAILNKNSHAYPSFFRDVFIYVGLSSLLILATSFGVYYASMFVFGVDGNTASNLMLLSLVLMSVLNFLTTIYFDDFENKWLYMKYTIIIGAVFMIFASLHLNFLPFSLLKAFYELGTYSFAEWVYLLIVLLPGAIIFAFLHYLRSHIMDKYFYKNLFVKKF